eukprot:TRINITY_DN20216_c0_g1_i1.p1 TRINITY_DN20216_c0_g1~~TRINITY_DN20216_c0_g1_i1.p1  ORF type:complete len:167 (-),score=71.35 TRINITY_DN20216_c0_g1_i1:706-1206(-)
MGKGAGRGKFKSKPTGRKNFSTPEEMAAGTSGGRRFKKGGGDPENKNEEESEEEESSSSEDEASDKQKGVQGLIQVENPNLVKPKTLKAKDLDESKAVELSRREREEIEKQRAKERYWKLHEAGKTDEARKDLERLALIRQQREEAAKKREEEKAAKDARAKEARK